MNTGKESRRHQPSYNFKTPAGQAQFMAAYDRALAQWPVSYATVFVPTCFGATHVLVSGPKGAPPVVLLHGLSTNATIWRRNVAALSHSHRTYLVDIVGLPNKSSAVRAPRTRQEAVAWLLDVFDGLEVEQPHLGGFSFGGWLTLNCAIVAPNRVQSIVPMACGLGRLRWLPLVRAMAGVVRMLVRPTPAGIRGLWRYLSAGDEWIEDAFVDQAYLGWKYIKLTRGVFPSGFGDDELRRLFVPTLLLEGQHTPAYSPQSAIDRAQRLIPQLQAEIVPDAGEMLPIEQPDIVNQRILQFLSETAP